uniref:Uncharacterized protein n=1 Tax=Siphoviridae sp. ctxMM9 TaxID=2827973 RepID=A0A8S5T6X0_9CAUD|nr:MAG TPA: hypothetical protein [Siphoviridae sp. ctxMM9]
MEKSMKLILPKILPQTLKKILVKRQLLTLKLFRI